jgi:hypothetical protein
MGLGTIPAGKCVRVSSVVLACRAISNTRWFRPSSRPLTTSWIGAVRRRMELWGALTAQLPAAATLGWPRVVKPCDFGKDPHMPALLGAALVGVLVGECCATTNRRRDASGTPRVAGRGASKQPGAVTLKTENAAPKRTSPAGTASSEPPAAALREQHARAERAAAAKAKATRAAKLSEEAKRRGLLALEKARQQDAVQEKPTPTVAAVAPRQQEASDSTFGILSVRVHGGCQNLARSQAIYIRVECGLRGQMCSVQSARTRKSSEGSWDEALTLVVRGERRAFARITCWRGGASAQQAEQLVAGADFDLATVRGRPVGRAGGGGRRGPFFANALTPTGFDGTIVLMGPGQGEETVRACFDSIDLDGSDSLDRSEVALLSNQLGCKLEGFFSSAKLDKAFANMQPDDDGLVGYEGFLAWWLANAQNAGMLHVTLSFKPVS